MYHNGNRDLQDRFDSRRIADRLVEILHRTAFSEEDRDFIQSRAMFFLATSDASGWPDCSYKGGHPGFVRVIDTSTLAFPSYDGNGMFKSLGNVMQNPKVGLLFIDFENGDLLQLTGRAWIDWDAPEIQTAAGVQRLLRVHPTETRLLPGSFPLRATTIDLSPNLGAIESINTRDGVGSP